MTRNGVNGRRFVLAAIIGVLALSGCERESIKGPATAEGLVAAGVGQFGPPDFIVRPGGSIQAALDAAAAGAVIHVTPGTYHEALVVDKPGIKLIGLGNSEKRHDHNGRVVIVNPGGAENGVYATPEADDFTLVNVTVRDFEENGVLLNGVDGFLLSRIGTAKNGEYGLFPVKSAHGLIERSSAEGHADAGIYVGQSDDVVVRDSEAFANVIGVEIENSTNVTVVDTRSHGNTAGMLIVLLPGLDVKVSAGIQVTGNDVRDNNLPNFAHPGELAAAVPSGSGILVVGSDQTQVHGNAVHGNDFVGIGVGSTLLLGVLAGLPPEAFADIEPNPDGVEVTDNQVTGNGAAPPPLPIPLPGVDLLWDGSGIGNCWSGNTFNSSFPPGLPACS